jgi:hypothetical protein
MRWKETKNLLPLCTFATTRWPEPRGWPHPVARGSGAQYRRLFLRTVKWSRGKQAWCDRTERVSKQTVLKFWNGPGANLPSSRLAPEYTAVQTVQHKLADPVWST